MKKRALSLIIAIVLSLSFSSCGYMAPANSYAENGTADDGKTDTEVIDIPLPAIDIIPESTLDLPTAEEWEALMNDDSVWWETDVIPEPTLDLPTAEEWEALINDDSVWWNGVYDAVNALLSGDIDEFERCMGVPAGVYDSFRGMVITDYKIGVEDIPYYFDPSISRMLPILTIDVAESNSDYLTPGTHELVFDEGLWITFSKREEINSPTEYLAATSYISYLGSDRDFYSVLGEGRRQFGLPDFIVGRLNWLADDYEPRSAREIREYSEKYLGVDGDTLQIEYFLEKVDGGYQCFGRGGGSYEFEVLSEEIVDGVNVVTVQFYADYSGIIPSRKVEFHMELLDGEYRPIKSAILSDSDFETAYWST